MLILATRVNGPCAFGDDLSDIKKKCGIFNFKEIKIRARTMITVITRITYVRSH